MLEEKARKKAREGGEALEHRTTPLSKQGSQKPIQIFEKIVAPQLDDEIIKRVFDDLMGTIHQISSDRWRQLLRDLDYQAKTKQKLCPFKDDQRLSITSKPSNLKDMMINRNSGKYLDLISLAQKLELQDFLKIISSCKQLNDVLREHGI
jgi:hypothetical protein